MNTAYNNPRQGENKQNSDVIAQPVNFTHDAYERNMLRLLNDKGYMACDYFDQKMIDKNSPTVFFNFIMQYSPEATLDLLKILDNVSQGTPIPLCMNVRMDSESFDVNDQWVKETFDQIQSMKGLDVSYAVMVSPNDDVEASLAAAAQKLKDITGVEPKGFHVVPRAGNQVPDLPDEMLGMKNVVSPSFKNHGDMWSDSNGGWFGALDDKLDTVDGSKSLLIQNSEGAWWSPEPMHAWDRLCRIGTSLQGRFPETYVEEVKAGKRFIPGEKGSIVTADPNLQRSSAPSRKI